MADSMTRIREVRKSKRWCENSFSAEESYQGAMSGTKRHATLHRKAEELVKLCNARFALFLTIRRVIFRSGQRTRPRPEKASPSSKKCEKPNSSSRGKHKGKKKGVRVLRRKRLKLDKFSRALETQLRTLEDNINSSFAPKTKTILPYGNAAKEDHGEESMAELLQPNSYNFHDDNIEFRYGFDSNGICGNVNLEPGYNGDFGLVKLENFGGVDNYNCNPPLGFFPQSFHYNIGANLMGFESCCPENNNIGVINSVCLLQAQAAGSTCCKEETYQ